MKTIIKILLLLYISSASVQPLKKITLESRSQDSQYLSKKTLSLSTSTPKIKYLKADLGFESVQVNTDRNHNNINGDAANEPSIAVNPLNPKQIAIGWRQFNTISSDFRQAGRSYSNDGGLTWNYQEVFEPGVFRSDPVLAANADGNFYYQSLRVTFDQQGNFNEFFVDQWKSYTGGETWVEKTFAFGGDKTWIAIDKTDGTTRGNIYAAWNTAGNQFFPNTFNSSVNNGLSFSQPTQIPRSPVFGTVDVGADGDLYIFGIDGLPENNSLASLYLIKSINPSILSPLFPIITKIDLGGPLRIGGIVNDLGLDGQLYVKLDKSNRASRNNVYVLGSINPLGIDPLDVNFARSTDGGVTFSDHKRINSDDTNDWQWFGTMSVAPNGRIDVIWNDTRNNDGTDNDLDTTSRLFYTYSYDAGISFSKEQAISPRFNQLRGYPVQRKMGDYIDMESDNLGAHIAYTATFNNEQDIYYVYAKPSSIEENPDFPTILTNNVWAVEGVPSQGILSTTLINSGNPENPLLAFEAIFTAKPDGTPIWLVATGEIPKTTDQYTVPIYIPTGDLSTGGEPLLAIGIMTKRRLRDANNELVDNKIEYIFDMSDKVKQQLQDTLGSQYNEEFFDNNPFHSIEKTLTFNSLLPRKQMRKDLCNINGQFLSSIGEQSEGRIQFTYLRENTLNLFAADFTYKKTINAQGIAEHILDDNGLATPTWEVLQSTEGGILIDNSVENTVFTPNGGLGFFEAGDETGITSIGTEKVTVQGTQLTTVKPDKTKEIMSALANNAYCGDIK